MCRTRNSVILRMSCFILLEAAIVFLFFFFLIRGMDYLIIYRGDDKSLARPGRKQATVTKL